VTILFLPVSLMTGYFGVSIDGVSKLYSLRTYWVCFGVVAVLTSSLLLVYTFVNGRVGGQINYQSLTTMLLQGIRRRKAKHHGIVNAEKSRKGV
jgi:hypothetical protein